MRKNRELQWENSRHLGTNYKKNEKENQYIATNKTKTCAFKIARRISIVFFLIWWNYCANNKKKIWFETLIAIHSCLLYFKALKAFRNTFREEGGQRGGTAEGWTQTVVTRVVIFSAPLVKETSQMVCVCIYYYFLLLWISIVMTKLVRRLNQTQRCCWVIPNLVAAGTSSGVSARDGEVQLKNISQQHLCASG